MKKEILETKIHNTSSLVSSYHLCKLLLLIPILFLSGCGTHRCGQNRYSFRRDLQKYQCKKAVEHTSVEHTSVEEFKRDRRRNLAWISYEKFKKNNYSNDFKQTHFKNMMAMDYEGRK